MWPFRSNRTAPSDTHEPLLDTDQRTDAPSVPASPRGHGVVSVLHCNKAIDFLRHVLAACAGLVLRLTPLVGCLLPPPWRRHRLTEAEAHVVTRMRVRAETSYDKENPEHRVLLKSLWAASFPDDEPPSGSSVRSSKWRELGYQGDDPTRDFRSTGLLSLDLILYLAKERPLLYDKLRFRDRHGGGGQLSGGPEDGYPFAAATVNVTAMLAEIMGAREAAGQRRRGRKLPLDAAGKALAALAAETEGGLGEVFCAAVDLLDRKFAETGAGHMQFPSVLKEVRRIVHKELSRMPRTTGDLERSLGRA